MSERRVDRLVAPGLFASTLVVLALTAQDLGFTRDEGYYFKAGERYWGWFAELGHSVLSLEVTRAFRPEIIDRYWSYNHEHPALMKTLFAWGYGFQSLTGYPFYTHNALRFGGWLMAALSVVLVYGLSRELLPRRAAILAACSWIAMPHVFWHMHLACFDVGVCAAHVGLVWAYWRWRSSGRWGAVGIAVVYALAAAVKHNVLPVPGLMVLHHLLFHAQGPSQTARGYVLPAIPLPFIAMCTVSPLVYLAQWPWLWPDPFGRFGQYLNFHFSHEHYPILYFGDLLTHPPFPVSFPFVMSAITIPVGTLVAMVLGFVMACVVASRALWIRLMGDVKEGEMTRVPLGDVSRASSGSAAALLAMNALFPFVLIALPSTPIFGGTKHWMNGLPFLCILSGWLVCEAIQRLRAAGFPRSSWAFVVVGAWMVIPGMWMSTVVWPYGLGSYNELIGFSRGAANVGMQRTFWGYEPREALPFLNQVAPRGARIHLGDTNNDDARMYQRDGLLRRDLVPAVTVRGSAVASVQPQGEFKQQWLDVWNEWGDRTPDVVLGPEGVPVCTVTVKEPR